MKYAAYNNSTGNIEGFYDDSIHSSIPTPNIQISDDNWLEELTNPGTYKVNTSTQLIELIPPPSSATLLQNAKDAKIAELTVTYKTDLVNGFSSSALGSAHNYANDAISQATLNSLIIAGATADYIYYTGNSPTNASHTLTALQQVLADLISDRQTAMNNFETKIAAVNAATTINDVNTITW